MKEKNMDKIGAVNCFAARKEELLLEGFNTLV